MRFRLIYPSEFGIVNENETPLELIIANNSIFGKNAEIILQLDTMENFDSPAKIEYKLE
ncbi:MAG: hypothetical protein R2766_03805 [Saprospiraceae bacterium]